MTLQNVTENLEVQYELLPQTEVELLNSKIMAVHEMAHNVRRGIFKRQTEIEKIIFDMICRLERLEEK